MLNVLRRDLLVRRLLPQIIQLEIAISSPAATHGHNQHFLSDCYYGFFPWYMSFSLLTRTLKHYKCATDKSKRNTSQVLHENVALDVPHSLGNLQAPEKVATVTVESRTQQANVLFVSNFLFL